MKDKNKKTIKLLDFQDVMKILKVTEKPAREWLRRETKKGLPALKVGREWRIEETVFLSWLQGKRA